MNQYATYSLQGCAEPVSSLSHLFGAILFAALTIRLVRLTIATSEASGEGPGRLMSVCIFASSAVILLSISGIYHLLPFDSARRELFLQLDYVAIYLLIAGTFTPCCWLLLAGFHRRVMLIVIWGLAVTGIVISLFFSEMMPDRWNIAFYLIIGWAGLISGKSVSRRHGLSILEPLLLGGAAYTTGVAFILAGRPEPLPGVVGPHELFHLAVLVGIGCHWRLVTRLAEGQFAQPELAPVLSTRTSGA